MCAVTSGIDCSPLGCITHAKDQDNAMQLQAVL